MDYLGSLMRHVEIRARANFLDVQLAGVKGDNILGNIV